MTRLMRPLICLFLLLSLCTALFSCSTIGGTYEARVGDTVALTLRFTHGGKIKIYLGSKERGEEPVSVLSYKIEDGKFYSWSEEQEEADAVGVAFQRGRDDTGEYIKIGESIYYRG
jgi:hypothetical protein